ncbi:MAG: outer membrane lipoprotein carrier protein LolA [Myxococcales bacterium]|nr:outer membrane lipoprotein carrier protein LolA [Myxococcales bacterium]
MITRTSRRTQPLAAPMTLRPVVLGLALCLGAATVPVSFAQAQPATAPAAQPAPATPAAQPPPARPPATAGKPATEKPGPAAGNVAPASSAERPPLPQIVDRIQKLYEGTQNLKARFSQTLQTAMGKRQASGVLRLKKPGKMRWDYEKPEKKLFVTDGSILWMYEPEDEQAFRQPLNSSQLPAQVSFLFGKGRLSDEFEISYLDGQKLGTVGDLVLKLVPKKATAQYKHLFFVVDGKTGMVKETVLFDQQGGSNHIVFSAIETNLKADIDDSRFAFTPPPNTKIINPR